VPEGIAEEAVGAVQVASVDSDETCVAGMVMPSTEEEDFLSADVFGSSADSCLLKSR